MANKQMSLYLKFNNLGNDSAPEKSLINFLAENSSVYFEHNSNDESDQSISCNIAADTGVTNMYGGTVSRFVIKYDDPNNDKFIPIKRPTFASVTSKYNSSSSENGIYNLTVTAAEPGPSGNGYSVRIIINSSAPYREIEVRKDGEAISRGTLSSSMLEKYSAEMYYLSANDTNSLRLNNGDSLTTYVKLSGGGYCYFKRAQTNYSAWFEVGPTAGGTEDSDEANYDISDWSSVLRCNTVLCKANSKLSLYDTYQEDIGFYRWYKNSNFNEMPVIISPTINSKPVDDETIIPQVFDEDSMAIIKLANNSYEYDTPLRTTTFTVGIIEDDYYPRLLKSYDLYYKLGIFPMDGNSKTVDNILKYFRNQCLELSQTLNYWLAFSVGYAPWQSVKYKSDPFFVYDFTTCDRSAVPKSIVFPIYNVDDPSKIAALVYMKLYGSDDKPFTKDIFVNNGSGQIMGIFAKSREYQRLSPITKEYSSGGVSPKSKSDYSGDGDSNIAYRIDTYYGGMYIGFEDSSISGFIRSYEIEPSGTIKKDTGK